MSVNAEIGRKIARSRLTTAALPTDGADEPRGEGWVRVFGAPSSCLALFGRTILVPSLWEKNTRPEEPQPAVCDRGRCSTSRMNEQIEQDLTTVKERRGFLETDKTIVLEAVLSKAIYGVKGDKSSATWRTSLQEVGIESLTEPKILSTTSGKKVEQCKIVITVRETKHTFATKALKDAVFGMGHQR